MVVVAAASSIFEDVEIFSNFVPNNKNEAEQKGTLFKPKPQNTASQLDKDETEIFWQKQKLHKAHADSAQKHALVYVL